MYEITPLTRFPGTPLVGWNHVVRDDGREFSVDVLLASVDNVFHDIHEILEQTLINPELLLQYMESSKSGSYFHRSTADVSMKFSYYASCVADKGRKHRWHPPGERPAVCY